MPLSRETEDAVTCCALRFDGYKLADVREAPDLLAQLTDQYLATLRLSEDPLENLAVFFALQRFLCKWGGDYLSKTAMEHRAYRLLFLHLYRTEIDPQWRIDEYWREWQGTHAARAEEIAAEVRADLLRVRRPKSKPKRPK
jgi:hypothetical protein